MARVISRKDCLVVPKSLRAFYLHAAHNNSGHAGRDRVLENLSNFWWEGRNMDIRSYIAQCDTCGQRKGRYGKRPLVQGHNERGRAPWQIIYIDFIQMPNCRGLKYALTLMDSLTKFVEVYPLAHDRALIPRVVYRKWCSNTAANPRLYHVTAVLILLETSCKSFVKISIFNSNSMLLGGQNPAVSSNALIELSKIHSILWRKNEIQTGWIFSIIVSRP